MTNQELYDQVKQTLLEQGGAGYDGYGGCLYRAPNGRVCAAGALILDEFYDEKLEGLDVEGHDSRSPVADALLCSGVARDQLKLVQALQGAHDDVGADAAAAKADNKYDEVAAMTVSLARIAQEFGLTP